jgi:trimeric autotransporter adhesin
MFDRSGFKVLLSIGLLVPLSSCSSPSLTSIVVTPDVMNFGGPGLTTQLTAIGYYTHPGHDAETKNITDEVSWSSSTPACVTVDSAGLITSGENVCTNIPITAAAPGYNGIITGSMTVNVTQPTNSGSDDIKAISIAPSSRALTSIGQTARFSAIGTTGTGETVDLTNSSTWTSSNPAVAAVDARTGNGKVIGAGTAVILATYKTQDGMKVISGTVVTIPESAAN